MSVCPAVPRAGAAPGVPRRWYPAGYVEPPSRGEGAFDVWGTYLLRPPTIQVPGAAPSRHSGDRFHDREAGAGSATGATGVHRDGLP